MYPRRFALLFTYDLSIYIAETVQEVIASVKIPDMPAAVLPPPAPAAIAIGKKLGPIPKPIMTTRVQPGRLDY